MDIPVAETSRPATFNDLKSLLRSLHEHGVEYLLIGGYALFAHGLFRTTTDIDIIVPQTKESGEKLVNALMVMPDKAARDIKPEWFDEGETIRLADEYVVDIMFNAGGESYSSLQPYAEVIDVEGIPVRTLNLEGLLKTKQTVRDKDAFDRTALEQALSKIKNNLK